MLENIEKATSRHVLIWACRVEALKAQRSALTASMNLKTLMPSGRTPKNMHLRLCAVTSANTMGQGTNSGSALHIERNVGNVATTTLRQYADSHGDNK